MEMKNEGYKGFGKPRIPVDVIVDFSGREIQQFWDMYKSAYGNL